MFGSAFQKGRGSLCALEALSYTTEESQENSGVICTFHQHDATPGRGMENEAAGPLNCFI